MPAFVTFHASTLSFIVALLLGSLRMPYPEIRSLVFEVSESLTDQMLGQLLKYLPKREEMDSLASYKSKISELSDAEQFAVVVSYRVEFIYHKLSMPLISVLYVHTRRCILYCVNNSLHYRCLTHIAIVVYYVTSCRAIGGYVIES